MLDLILTPVAAWDETRQRCQLGRGFYPPGLRGKAMLEKLFSRRLVEHAVPHTGMLPLVPQCAVLWASLCL